MTEQRSGLVAIVGKPNVGKSTFLNTLLATKVAPTSPKPQTTRRNLRGIYSETDCQLVFVDTPGLHEPQDALGGYMQEQLNQALSDVQAVCFLVDLRRPPDNLDRILARRVANLPVLLIGTKADLVDDPEGMLELYSELVPAALVKRAVCALESRDLAWVLDILCSLMPEGPLLYPPDLGRSDQSPESWAGELIREAMLQFLHDELPYASTVLTSEFSERPNGLIYIKATIYVERDSQRGIVIGRGGRMLGEIGHRARKTIELMTNRKVYLDLQVDVYPKWRQDPEALRELGYV